MKSEPQSFLWRAYAIVFVLLAGIQRTIWTVSHGAPLKWVATAIILCSCVGITTWAFGYRVGVPLIWKCLSALLAISLLYDLYPSVSSLAAGKAAHWNGSWIAALLTAVPLYGIACFALLRAGGEPRSDIATGAIEDVPAQANSRLERLKTRTL